MDSITSQELSFRLRGGLYEPGQPEYEDARTLFNSAIDTRPRYVARVAAPDDVIAALAFARERGLPVAVRGGGHSVTGKSLAEDGLVLDVRGMSDVDVDVELRTARVGAGATWSQFDRAAQEHGLATTGGRVSTTGVAGLTLGGGSGWLERKHGLAADNLLAAELVTANGELVRASEDENEELLWALRGGGGNFGVVTSLEFRLHPVGPEVFAGLALWPAEHGAELLKLFRDVMVDAPEGLGLAFDYITAPEDDPDVPEELKGKPAVAIPGMYAGSVEEGEESLRAIREFGPPVADFFGPVAYADFQSSIDDPPGYRNYWTADPVKDLTDPAIAAIHEHSAGLKPGPSQIFIVPWGGAVARAGKDTSPLAGRNAGFIVHPLLLWEDAADDAEQIAYGRSWRELLAPFATGDVYLNFVGDEGQERLKAGFGDSHARLTRLKAKYDPDNVFSGNQNLAPAEPAAA
jgi:FAD/FMN-containing dehydrogenase